MAVSAYRKNYKHFPVCRNPQLFNMAMEESYHLLLQNTVVDYIYLLGYTLLSLFSVTIILNALEIGTKSRAGIGCCISKKEKFRR